MQKLRLWLASPRWPLAVVVVAVVLTLPALATGFMLDDFTHRLMLDPAEAVHRAPWNLFCFYGDNCGSDRAMQDLGLLPWWASRGLRLSFFRPLTSLSHALDYLVFPRVPALMHAESIALYAALCGLVAVLYRRLLGATWVAGLAALLFAIDDAHSTPVTWLANRNALLAGLFGLAALIVHIRAVTGAATSPKIVAPALFVLALLSGEAAIAALMYIVAYAVWMDERQLFARLVSLVPYVAVAALWLVAYRAMGFGAEHSAMYLDPTREPGSYLVAFVERAPILLLGQFAGPPSDVTLMLPPSQVPQFAAAAALVVAVGGVVVWAALRGARPARFFVTGMILSLLPLCATWPNDRLLLLVGFGAFGIVAMFLAAVGEVARPLRWAAMPLAAFLVLMHLVAAPLLMPIRIVELPPIFKRLVARAAATLWHDDRPPYTIDVIVNAPDAVTLLHASATRILESGEAVQRRLLLLGVAVVGRIAVDRIDGRTIAIDFGDGFPRDLSSRLFRDQGEAFAVGDEVRGEGVVVRIAACDPEKGPTRIVYRFDVPLEDPKLNWLVWQDTGFVPYRPPPVGAREERAAIDWREAAGIVATRARP